MSVATNVTYEAIDINLHQLESYDFHRNISVTNFISISYGQDRPIKPKNDSSYTNQASFEFLH